LNLLFRTGVGDTHCGMRGFRKDALERLNLQMPGMELASEMVIKSALAKQRVEEIPITLWPDGRDRRPHLRSFRDGWGHLPFMLMCCPMFLFVLPGLLMVLASLAAIPVVVLAGYGVFTNVFGPNFMYTASVVSISGAHLLFFGLLAKLYVHQIDPAFQDPRIKKLKRVSDRRARAVLRPLPHRGRPGPRAASADPLVPGPRGAGPGAMGLRRHPVRAGRRDVLRGASRNNFVGQAFQPDL
jgi:hypothetical protein